MLLAAGLLAQALLLRNGHIWTGEREVTQLACNHGVVEGGSVEKPLVVDLHGRRALPGFHDSHTHLLAAGLQISRFSLADAVDEADLGRRLQAVASKLPKGVWVIGGAWNERLSPTAAMLDKFVADRPVLLHHYSPHVAVANTLALKLAGITAETPEPEGGRIDRRDGSRDPTGVLHGSAAWAVEQTAPIAVPQEVEPALDAALEQLPKNGITAVEDIEDASDSEIWRRVFQRYQELQRTGKLRVRVDLWRLITRRAGFNELGIEAGFGNDMLRLGTVKAFMDGSLRTKTAKMFSPYRTDPDWTGAWATENIAARIREAAAARLQIGVHAIGDRANAELLDAYAAAIKANGARDRRFRVEHAQHLRPQDIPRFHELGVIASIQPSHVLSNIALAEQSLPREVLQHSFAVRELLDAKAIVAFGSDWPVAPLSPLVAIDAAVHRRTGDGRVWSPQQRVTPQEAVRAYTWGSAYASLRDASEGTLEPGKLCDVVVLTKDILADEPGAQVALTVLGGKIVWQLQRGDE